MLTASRTCWVLQGSSSEALARTKTEYEAFLGDAAKLKAVREKMQVGGEQEGISCHAQA